MQRERVELTVPENSILLCMLKTNYIVKNIEALIVMFTN